MIQPSREDIDRAKNRLRIEAEARQRAAQLARAQAAAHRAAQAELREEAAANAARAAGWVKWDVYFGRSPKTETLAEHSNGKEA